MSAPSRARRNAVARPMPREPPVMSATRLLKSVVILLLLESMQCGLSRTRKLGTKLHRGVHQAALADPILGHDFLIQVNTETRPFRYRDFAGNHWKALFAKVLTQGALLDAILKIVGIRQGGDEMKGGS